MKKIVCMFNLFDVHQNIMLVDEDEVRVVGITRLNLLGQNIAELCNEYDCNEVHLYGSAKFAENIIRNIVKENSLSFDNRPINIEVN